MTKYLAKFKDVVSEIEIEVTGIRILTDREVQNLEELATSITWNFNYEFGEDNAFRLEYSDGEDFLSRIEFKEITNDEARLLKRLFNDEFGTFIGEDFLQTVIGDEDSEYDEDEDDDDMDYETDY
jgi:hypothetical protein